MSQNLFPVALYLTVASVAQAQTLTPEQALTRLFAAPEIQQDWFAPEFLAQIPWATIQAQFKSIAAQFGAFQRLDTYQGRPQAVYERGTLIVTAAPLDAQGRFTSFGAVPGPGNTEMTAEQQQLGIQMLQKLLAVEPLDTSLLSQEFLQAVPEAQIRASLTEIRQQLGAVRGVSATPEGWDIQFEKGTLPVLALQVNEAGLITTLRVGAALPKFSSLDEAKAAFAALPGQVSLLVQESGQTPLVNLNASRLLAIGSTFKLAILGELQAQVSAGKRQWTDQVTLTDADKSLPTGTLQDAPSGSQSLQDLAARMIRDSDNTATDLLLKTVGRAGVEARLGQAAMPSTREAFALKNPANLELLRAYRSAGLNTAARREVLKQADAAPLPNAASFASGKTLARDVEWFASNQRLCSLMADVAARPEMQLNPGVATRNDFASVSFKGGSEPGVLNLTTQVTNKAGKTYCVSATWNRPQPLDDGTFLGLYQGVLQLLR